MKWLSASLLGTFLCAGSVPAFADDHSPSETAPPSRVGYEFIAAGLGGLGSLAAGYGAAVGLHATCGYDDGCGYLSGWTGMAVFGGTAVFATPGLVNWAGGDRGSYGWTAFGAALGLTAGGIVGGTLLELLEDHDPYRRDRVDESAIVLSGLAGLAVYSSLTVLSYEWSIDDESDTYDDFRISMVPSFGREHGGVTVVGSF